MQNAKTAETAETKIIECRKNEKIIEEIHCLCRHIKHCKLKGRSSIYLEAKIAKPSFDPKYFNSKFFATGPRYLLKTTKGQEIYIDEIIPKLQIFYENLFKATNNESSYQTD